MFKVTLTTCQMLSSHVWLVVTSLAVPIQNFSAIAKSTLGLCGRGIQGVGAIRTSRKQRSTRFLPRPPLKSWRDNAFFKLWELSLILHNQLTFFFVGQDPYRNTGSPLFRLGSENLPDHRVHDLGAMNHAPIGKLESLVPQSAWWNFPAHLLVLTCFSRTLYICFLQTSRTEYKLEALLLHLPMWFSLELNSVSRNVWTS